MTFKTNPNIGLETEFCPIRDQYENCDVGHMSSDQLRALRDGDQRPDHLETYEQPPEGDTLL